MQFVCFRLLGRKLLALSSFFVTRGRRSNMGSAAAEDEGVQQRTLRADFNHLMRGKKSLDEEGAARSWQEEDYFQPTAAYELVQELAAGNELGEGEELQTYVY